MIYLEGETDGRQGKRRAGCSGAHGSAPAWSRGMLPFSHA